MACKVIFGIFALLSFGIVTVFGEENEIFIRRDTRKSMVACADRDPTLGLDCPNNCTTAKDCSVGEQCICLKECGMSCRMEKNPFCRHPGFLENGRVVHVGSSGFYDMKFLLEKVPNKGQVLFECDDGFTLGEGPPSKVCEDGMWEPPGFPRCVDTQAPGFNWFRPLRVKRRAIKTGGSTSMARAKAGPGGSSGGLNTRRGKKRKGALGDDEDFDIISMSCYNLDDIAHHLLWEVIHSGEGGTNDTFSIGTVVKVSCKPGYGVNLANETVKCEKGKWRPKIPQCSALPCKTPFITNGVFYEGFKPLYFQENKKHDTVAILKCLKGYKLKGPSKFNCVYGEWDVNEAPECLPAPCKLPNIEAGAYFSGYERDMYVQHGTEIDYNCIGANRKLMSGPVRCDLGEWKPNIPYCVHQSISSDSKNKMIQPATKKACPQPIRMQNATSFVNGLPLDWRHQKSFPDSTDVLYRCSMLKTKTKNRWKITCEDGHWTGSTNLTCDGGDVVDKWMVLPNVSMINGSCPYKKMDPHVVNFYNDQVVVDDVTEFPHGTVLTSRCVDIGKFRLYGAARRKCLSGQWMGIRPTCDGLSQFQDYALDKPPTILFRFENGSIVQSTEGNLIVYPGTTLHMECLWIRKFGKPSWSTSIANKTYPEGWATPLDRDSSLEYRITIENASKDDEGRFACKTPARHIHEINVLVKEAQCPPLQQHHDLIYSSTDTILGAVVTFQCKENNSLIGAQEIFCQENGKWSSAIPRCENVQCPDISLVPALAPLDYTSITWNGTLKKNGTAPPRVSLYSGTGVGARVYFTCDQGYMIEGHSEAVCKPNGAWSSQMPLCKEVECPSPPIPENGRLTDPTKEHYKAGDFANYECAEGYMMEGQPMLACQDNGKWSKASGIKCKLGCPYPGTIIFGTISEVKFYYDIGATVQFQCHEGYMLQGSKKMTCQKQGKWSPIGVPTCVPENYDHISNRKYFVGQGEGQEQGKVSKHLT